MLKHSSSLFVLFLLMTVCASTDTITSVSAMRDKDGNIIRDCQQPHIVKFGAKWYAYGFDRHTYLPPPNNTLCYSSSDLKTWTFEDTLFRYSSDTVLNGFVLYNSKNNEFVFLPVSEAAYCSPEKVFTSPNPTGPFTFHNFMNNIAGPNNFGDPSVFVDTDGKAYFLYTKYGGDISQRYCFIYQLNDDFYDVVPSTFCNTNTVMEGLWMVKHNSTYFLFGSGLVGCDVDDNFYITAPSPLGPWTYRGYFVPLGSKTFNSQTFMGLQVTGSKGSANVFIGEVANCTANGRSIWLPLVFNSDTTVQEMKWYDQWTLDTAGAVGFIQDTSPIVHWVDDKDASVRFTGSWFSESYSSCYAGGETYSNTAGDYVEFGFRGKSVSWLGTIYPNRGKADIYIDGVLDSSGVDLYSSGLIYQHVHYQKTWATQDTHTIKIVANGTKNANSSDYYLSVDAFTYTEANTTTATASNKPVAETAPLSVYPNPFNPVCRISYNLKNIGRASLSIYDLSGRFVVRLMDGTVTAGSHVVTWNGVGQDKKQVSTGAYLCRLVVGNKTITGKMVFAR